MDKHTLIGIIKEMADSPSCHPDLRAAVRNYFDALKTPRELAEAQNFIAELQASVVKVEQLVIFAHSNSAIDMFGAEAAKKFAANADELKRRGEKYCNCKACTLGLEILKHKEILLS